MNIDEQLEHLAHLQCPRQVDVTDRVMREVRQHPYLRPVHRGQTLRRIGIAAVAATLALVVINVTTVYTRSYDEDGLGDMIAQYNDYSSWNTVEELAVNPYEYLYDE
ncbi:MAG: hypothetical protein IK058_00430 [Bacteroidales bacterium]|nr:hypothetical protein [Bacteroidales bacterium]